MTESKRLTHDDVFRIVGEIDDAKAAAIIATGATVKELEEAAMWASDESDVMGEMERPLSGRVAALYEILMAGEEYEERRPSDEGGAAP